MTLIEFVQGLLDDAYKAPGSDYKDGYVTALEDVVQWWEEEYDED